MTSADMLFRLRPGQDSLMLTLKHRHTDIMVTFLIVWALLDPTIVFGTTCSYGTGGQCQESMFTLSTCGLNSSCDCRLGYFPVHTGCAKKIKTPTIEIDRESSHREVIAGNGVYLKCTSEIDVPYLYEFVYYHLMKDDQIFETSRDQTSHGYSTKVHFDSEDDAGNFSCRITLEESESNYIDSEESNKLQVTVLSRSGSTTRSSTNPHSEWTQMPKLRTDGPTTTTQSSSLFDPTWSRVGLLISVDRTFARSHYTFTAGYEFRCLVVVCTATNDSPYWFGLYDLEVNYTFYESYENTDHVTETSREDYYLVPYGVHHIYCTAEYEIWKAISNTITITFIENYVVRPVLTASTGTKLVEGSRLVLTCGEPQNVSYIWEIHVGGSYTVIPLQRDYKIQVGDFIEKDAGEYRCYVFRDDWEYCESSNSVTVTMVQNISQPIIKRLDDGDTFVEGKDYQLECHTDSETPGMTYSWEMNDYLDLETAGKIYTISNASFNDHYGLYRCTAFFNGKVSRHSDSFLVSVKNSSSTPAATSPPVIKRLDDGDTFVEGEDYQLECNIDSATPGTTYSWWRNYTDLGIKGKTYSISCASPICHNGNYQCAASVGDKVSLSRPFLVEVQRSPWDSAVISQPVIKRLDTEDTFVEGEDYQLECHTDSVTPAMTYVWRRNNSDLPTTGSVYSISNASPTRDTGDYMCIASLDGYNASSDDFRVKVLKRCECQP